MEAIRDAARRLGARHLSGCEIHATSHPCAMCEWALYWARVERIFHGAALSLVLSRLTRRAIHLTINGLAAGLRNSGWASAARRRSSEVLPRTGLQRGPWETVSKRARRFHARCYCDGAGRISSPVVETSTSYSASRSAGANVADPYSTSSSGASAA